MPHCRDQSKKSVRLRRGNIVCALLGLKTDFWATESRVLIPAKPAVFVSSRVIEEHGVIVQQLDGLGCQH